MSISSISGSPYAAAGVSRQQRAQERFEAADTDKSGGLSLEEFQASGPKDAEKSGRSGGNRPSAEEMFARMDSDGDGSLTQTEMETAFQSMRSQTKGALLAAQEEAGGANGGRPPGPPPGGPGGPGGAGGPPPGPPRGADGTEASATTGGSDIASLLSSGSSSSGSTDEDALGTLISQLQSAINSYSQKNGSGTSGTIAAKAA